jgi:hypothetical protein
MERKKKLDNAVTKLRAILDRNTEGLPAAEVDAKWHALAKVVSKVETHAKQQGLRQAHLTRRPARKHA